VAPYTVVWATDVQNDFIDRWIDSDSEARQRLTDIANAIDRELSIKPETKGEALPSEPALRVWSLPGFSPTVSTVFELLPDDRIVRVLRISTATA
jgi:hypothetical protein